MGNHKFRLFNIIPTNPWLSRRLPNPKVPKPQQPNHRANEQVTSKKALPIHTFDEMLLLSSSSRSFRTERLPLCPETEHDMPQLTLTSNSDDSPTGRKVHTKCCHGVRLKLKPKSPRINAASNAHRTKTSASNSSMGCGKRMKGVSEGSVTTVVKSSANPETDFRESMVEMIVENKITDLDGLEELLVSYLVLNSDQFHEVILSVFKDIVVRMFRKPNLKFQRHS